MSPEEQAEMQALGRELAGADQSLWEPRCVARTFARPRPGQLVLTMQRWIDLDAIQSPFLLERIPDYDAVVAAMDIFNLGVEGLTEKEAMDCAEGILQACSEAFALVLPMRPPEGGTASRDGGFGAWLTIFSFFAERQPLSEVRSLPVAQAYAILAGIRSNQGWEPSGTSYRLRDKEQPEEVEGEEAARA